MNDKTAKDTDIRKIKRIFGYFGPLKKYFFVAGLAIVISTLISLPVPYLNQRLIDDVIMGKDYNMLKYILIIWLVLLLVKPLISAVKRYNLDLFEMKFDLGVKSHIFSKVMHLPVNFFTKNQLGYIQSRIDGDVGALHSITAGRILGIFNNIVNLIFGLIMMCRIHWKLTVVSLMIIPFTILNGYVFADRMKEMNKRVSEVWANQRGNMFESIFGIEVIKNFLMENIKSNQFRSKFEEGIQINMKRTVLELIAGFFGMIISGIGPLIIWGYGAVLTIQDQITLGQLTAFIGFSGFVMGPAIQLASLKLNFQGAMAAWERIEEILNLDDEEMLRKNQPKLKIDKGLIEFKQVSFAFDGDDEKNVLSDVDLIIRPGEKVALVGSNGSGKSTLLKLLTQIHSDYEGEILIDGQRAKAHDLYSIREQIAFVSQDVFLFKGTILENIQMGDEAITEELVTQEMHKIRLDEFIKRLPEGLYTTVEERGANLSGGQKQLISIARAMMKSEVKILIFDEATSALDTNLEKHISQNIDVLCQGRTFINIAHRPSFMKCADRVIALDYGQVAFEGSWVDFSNHELNLLQIV